MKKNIRELAGFLAVVAVAICLTLTSAAPAFAQTATAGPALSDAEKQIVSDFEKRVKEYADMRERLEGKLPKLPKDATPEQITAHKQKFQDMVKAARTGAKHGDVFTPAAAAHIRAMIKRTFDGKERAELRQTVFEAETQGVPVRVNYTYPESKELVEMPPTLLLNLPQLPKQVRYRFVGRNLLLVDRENGLIVDYMTNALP
jgi:ABC-type transporter MlaC component